MYKSGIRSFPRRRENDTNTLQKLLFFNSKAKGLKSEQTISAEHITNNKSVRDTLLSRGIRPESLPKEEDIKKIERKLSSDNKKNLKNIDKIN